MNIRIVENTDNNCNYGILTIENINDVKIVQDEIYNIKNKFFENGIDDYTLDDIFSSFPDNWIYSFDDNNNIVEI